jgi:hypothetical protein
MPRLVVPHITCPSLSPSPAAQSFIIGPAVINTHTHLYNRSCSNKHTHTPWEESDSDSLYDGLSEGSDSENDQPVDQQEDRDEVSVRFTFWGFWGAQIRDYDLGN